MTTLDKSLLKVLHFVGNVKNFAKFSKKQFQAERNFLPKKKIIKELKKIAICLNDKKLLDIQEEMFDKVCLIICNTYERKNFDLHSGPLADGYIVAMNLKKLGYHVFFVHNPNRETFLTDLGFFLQKSLKSLIIYYSGRATLIPSRNVYKISEYDRALVFDQGYIVDGELSSVLARNANHKAKIVLISDCYEGNPVWDLLSKNMENTTIPQNIISISTDVITEPDMKSKIHRYHGYFTYRLFKIVEDKPDLTAEELATSINQLVKKFKQYISIETTTKGLERSSIFEV